MMRVRLSLVFPILLLTVALARGQERSGPSHLPIDDWGSGEGSVSRAQDIADRLRQAGIAQPPAPQVEPETIRGLLDMLEQYAKRDPKAFENALKSPELQKKLEDPNFARQLRNLSPENREFQRQLQERPKQAQEKLGPLLNK